MRQLRKRFGQHLLIDPSFIDNIIADIYPRPNDNMVEIGPGLGALTLPLLNRLDQLQVVELDRDLIPLLQNKCHKFQEKLIIHQADALNFDFTQLASKQKLRVVGNLPYNISTPLLFHLAEQRHVIQDMHFMLQQEVVMRLAAAENTEDYGRLSVMMQVNFDIEALLTVPPSAFNPPPKVYSAMVRLIPRQENNQRNNQEKIINREIFSNIVNKAFQQRRKTLRNALSGYIDTNSWSALEINPQSRPGELTVMQFIQLANHLAQKE